MTGVIFLKNLEKLELSEKLQNFEEIRKELLFFRNKIPLGGLKSPFNLEDETDYYSNPKETVFHCYVLSQGKKFSNLLEIFEKKFGDFSYQLVYGDTIEFFFNIVSESSLNKLEQDLEKFGGKKICKAKKIY